MEMMETYISKLCEFNLTYLNYQNCVVRLLASIEDINRQMNFEPKAYYEFVISFFKKFHDRFLTFYILNDANKDALESVPLFITSVASGIRKYHPDGFNEFVDIGKNFLTDKA